MGIDSRGQAAGIDDWLYPRVSVEHGIVVPQAMELDQWERQSMPLEITPTYRTLFTQFREFLVTEMTAIQDETLQQEVALLDQLLK